MPIRLFIEAELTACSKCESMAEDYRIPPDLQELGYTGGTYLGRGGEGCVYMFKYNGSAARGFIAPGQRVAVKITPGGKIRPNEVLVQSRIDHSGIVKVLDVSRCAENCVGIPANLRQGNWRGRSCRAFV